MLVYSTHAPKEEEERSLIEDQRLPNKTRGARASTLDQSAGKLLMFTFLYQFDKALRGRRGTSLYPGLELAKKTRRPIGTFGSHSLRTLSSIERTWAVAVTLSLAGHGDDQKRPSHTMPRPGGSPDGCFTITAYYCSEIWV